MQTANVVQLPPVAFLVVQLIQAPQSMVPAVHVNADDVGLHEPIDQPAGGEVVPLQPWPLEVAGPPLQL